MAKREITFEPTEIGGHVREMKGSNGLSYRPVPVTGIKSIDDPSMPEGTVQAFVSVTAIEDNVQDIIAPGAYGKTLRERKPKGVWSHDWDTWVAKTINATELMPNSMDLPMEVKELGGGALFVTCQFNLATSAGKDAYENVKFFADDCEWSIGYSVPPGGAKYDTKSGVRTINELNLFEYSPVLFGAMSMTSTLSVKSAFQRERIRLSEQNLTNSDEKSDESDLNSPEIAEKIANGTLSNEEMNELEAGILEKAATGKAPLTNKDDEADTKNALVDLHSKVARAKQAGSADAARSLGAAVDHTENAQDAADKDDHDQAAKSYNRAAGHADNAAEALGKDSTYGTKAAELADKLSDHAIAHSTSVAPAKPQERPLGKSAEPTEGTDMLCDHCQSKLEAKVAKLEGKASDAPAAESDDPNLVTCPACKGTGHVGDDTTQDCPDCKGTGKVTPQVAADIRDSDDTKGDGNKSSDDDDDDDKAAKEDQETCSTCDGSGKVKNGTTTCPTCNGSGVTGETQEKSVRIAIADVVGDVDAFVDDVVGRMDFENDEVKAIAKDKLRLALQKTVDGKKADTASTTTESKTAASSENDGLTEDELMEMQMLSLRSS